MRKHFEIKSIEVKGDVSMNSRTVTGYFSRFGNVDSDNDVIIPGAFKKTIKERGQEGANLIVHLADHKLDTGHLLGKPKLWEATDGGMFETTVSDTTKGTDVLKLYRDGVINQHSFGFKTIKNLNKGYNEIQEVMIYEVSTVVLGANDQTPFTGFKGLKEDELLERYNVLSKAWYDGDYTDEMFPILKAMKAEVEKEIIERYISLKNDTTQPPIVSIEPDRSEELKAAIQLLTIKLF